jgi:3-deoxy-D-manno-octulosonic-acid transferase
MIRCLYSLVMWLAQPMLRRKLRRRAIAEPGYGVAMQERFGYYDAPANIDSNRSNHPESFFVWVHAVSLGESRAAVPLILQLRQALPGMRLLLTHGTATGRAQGKTLLLPGDVQAWQPWDTQGAVQRFLTHFNPRVGLLMETEVWPNLVWTCAKAEVPLCLVNARFSQKSLHQAQRVAWLSHSVYRNLRAVWAQSQEDAARLAQLGAPVLGVMGNFKYDATPDPAQLAQGRTWRQAFGRPVLMFASSREGEELLLLQKLKANRAAALMDTAQPAIKSIANDVQWLLVPRHPQRFDEVVALCEEHGFSVSRRSQCLGGPKAAEQVSEQVSEKLPEKLPENVTNIWLGDSLGEMALYFGLSDVVLLGGSFAPLGGQNLIEAAACECPVFMGPHTFNFAQAAELAQAAGAAFEHENLSEAVDAALLMVHSPDALQQARTAAHQLGLAHQGAAQRTAAAVVQLLAA